MRGKALAERVKRAGPDIAEDDSERGERRGADAGLAAGMAGRAVHRRETVRPPGFGSRGIRRSSWRTRQDSNLKLLFRKRV